MLTKCNDSPIRWQERGREACILEPGEPWEGTRDARRRPAGARGGVGDQHMVAQIRGARARQRLARPARSARKGAVARRGSHAGRRATGHGAARDREPWPGGARAATVPPPPSALARPRRPHPVPRPNMKMRGVEDGADMWAPYVSDPFSHSLDLFGLF